MDMKIDPARLRRLREQRAWSQEQLADVAGLSVRTVQRIESGGGASPETRMALATAFGITPAELCDGHAPSPAADPPPVPDPPRAPPAHWFQINVVVLGWTILVLLLLGFGWQVGRDLAQREDREACREAAGRPGCPGR